MLFVNVSEHLNERSAPVAETLASQTPSAQKLETAIGQHARAQ